MLICKFLSNLCFHVQQCTKRAVFICLFNYLAPVCRLLKAPHIHTYYENGPNFFVNAVSDATIEGDGVRQSVFSIYSSHIPTVGGVLLANIFCYCPFKNLRSYRPYCRNPPPTPDFYLYNSTDILLIKLFSSFSHNFHNKCCIPQFRSGFLPAILFD